MRVAVLVVALAAFAHAQEDSVAAFDAKMAAHEYDAALAIAKRAHERQPSAYWSPRRAKARVAVARAKQRTHGYDAAITWLESRIEHELTAFEFGMLCLWAGREKHGLAHLAASGLPESQRWFPEIKLLMYLYRYRDAAAIAKRVGETEWVQWCLREANLRTELRARTARGWRVALFAALGLAGLAIVLWRAAPRATTATDSSL